MPDDEITSVRAWQALDSRGKPTVGVRVTTRGGAEGRAIAPAGASTGTHEARELRDGGTAYQGQGVSRAVENVRAVLAPELVGHSCLHQDDIDATVERADGTTDLGRLGANAAVAVSIAVLCAAGNHARLPLYRHVADRQGVVLPRPMINIISGGAHAAGMIDIQDVLAVPLSARTFAEAVEHASRVRDGTRLILADRGTPTALVADEGGLAAPFESNEAAIAAVSDGIERAGLRPGCDVGIAIDVAANQLMHAGGYALASESRLLTTKGLSDELLRWCTDYPVVSIEDVLSEDDWDGWKDATASLGLGLAVARRRPVRDECRAAAARHRRWCRQRGAGKAEPGGHHFPCTRRRGPGARLRLCHRAECALGRHRGHMARGPRSWLANRTDQGRIDDAS